MNCPACGNELTGLGTKCWAEGCGWVADQDFCSRREVSDSPLTPEGTARQPASVTLPWSATCSNNTSRLTKRYRQARTAARREVALQTMGLGTPLYDGEVWVRYEMWGPDNRRRDYHNMQKLLFDSMTGLLYADDSQITHWEGIKRGIDKDNPRVVIEVVPR